MTDCKIGLPSVRKGFTGFFILLNSPPSEKSDLPRSSKSSMGMRLIETIGINQLEPWLTLAQSGTDLEYKRPHLLCVCSPLSPTWCIDFLLSLLDFRLHHLCQADQPRLPCLLLLAGQQHPGCHFHPYNQREIKAKWMKFHRPLGQYMSSEMNVNFCMRMNSSWVRQTNTYTLASWSWVTFSTILTRFTLKETYSY